MLASATIDHYDADRRLLQEQNFAHTGTWQGDGATSTPPTTMPAVDATSWGGMDLQNQVTYRKSDGSSGYDAVGNITDYSHKTASSGRVDTYHVNYFRKDGYLERSTTGSSSDSNYRPATDTSYYNVFGQRLAIEQHVQLSSGTLDDEVRTFAFDANGEILRRRDGTLSSGTFLAKNGAGTIHYAYVNGQQVGSVDEGGGIDVLNGLTAFSNTETGTSGYVVQAADTLRSIAQAEYGDASLWYVIAQANGLDSDADLVAGQTLNVPQVKTNSNDATTFKPYNPAEISGSTAPPSVYSPPPPSQHHCSTLAMIVVIAVVVVATVFTAGAAAVAMGAVTAGTSTAAIGGAVLAGSAVAGVTAGEVLVAAAIGGVVGNIAGQVAGDVLGVHHGFSLGEAMVGGLTTLATAGVGGAISQGGSEFSLLAKANGTLRPAGAALLGASGYASNVVASKLTGQPTHFSWDGIVASAVGAGLTSAVGLPTNNQLARGAGTGNFLSDFEGGLVNGALQSGANRALGQRGASGEQIAEDAFGNAIANSVISYESALPPIPVSDDLDLSFALPSDDIHIDPAPVNLVNVGPVGLSGQPSSLGTQSSGWPPPGAHITDLGVVSVHPGEGGQVTNFTHYSAADEALYQEGWSMALANKALQAENARVQADRAADLQRSREISVRAAQIEHAQFEMLGQGLIGAAKAVPNLIPETANAALWLGKKGLALYALGTGNIETAQLINQAELPQVPLIFGYDNPYQAGGAQGMDAVVALASVPQMFEGAVVLSAKAAPYVSDFASALGDLRFSGSSGGYGGWANQLGAVGDLTGVRPSFGGTLDPVGVDLDVVPNAGATSIGKSGYASVQEFSDAAYTKYQGFVDEGYAAAKQDLQDGILRVPSGVSETTVLGTRTDQYARTAMQEWLSGEGIDEGTGQLIQVNRYLRDPAGSGSYRIPDVNIPGANQIYDATLGFKTWSTPQVRGFYQYSGGSTITIVRPTELGGSYSVLVPH